MDIYGDKFYEKRHQKTVYAANTILDLIRPIIPPVHSAVDVGCGVGTWLSTLKDAGVSEILGIDGKWVNTSLLQIPASHFQHADLDQPITVERSFDLAISLEVAEHLKPESARMFVNSLTEMSDFVLFSAAIPFQAVKYHINEQWPRYWSDLFAEKDYACFDIIRFKIWNDEEIPAWYRQNTLFFVKKSRLEDLQFGAHAELPTKTPFAIVHPQYYLNKINDSRTLKGSWKLFRRALKNKIRHISN